MIGEQPLLGGWYGVGTSLLVPRPLLPVVARSPTVPHGPTEGLHDASEGDVFRQRFGRDAFGQLMETFGRPV